jgi:hypothetical protein
MVAVGLQAAGLALIRGLGAFCRRITRCLASDRYTKAIEQLGSDKLDVHLGGIHALECTPWTPSEAPTVV